MATDASHIRSGGVAARQPADSPATLSVRIAALAGAVFFARIVVPP
jgi:hypothetical protein